MFVTWEVGTSRFLTKDLDISDRVKTCTLHPSDLTSHAGLLLTSPDAFGSLDVTWGPLNFRNKKANPFFGPVAIPVTIPAPGIAM